MTPITKPAPSNSGPKYRSALALARGLLVGFGVGVLEADGDGVRVVDVPAGVVEAAGEGVALLSAVAEAPDAVELASGVGELAAGVPVTVTVGVTETAVAPCGQPLGIPASRVAAGSGRMLAPGVESAVRDAATAGVAGAGVDTEIELVGVESGAADEALAVAVAVLVLVAWVAGLVVAVDVGAP